MHILYIEDDLVDQMMFKRLCKEINLDISYKIVGSVEELKKVSKEASFDLIFSDIFLPDGDVNDVLQFCEGSEVVIVSGETSPEFLETFVKYPYATVYNKPLTEDNIVKSLKTQSSCSGVDKEPAPLNENDYTAIKLTNLQRLSKGDPKDMIDLMDIALDLLPQRMEELATGFEQSNWPQVHFSAHAAKGVSRLVGIPVYEELGELDRKARMEEPDPAELFTIYESLLPVMKQAYTELSHLKEIMSQA